MAIRLPAVVGSIVEAALTPHPVDRYLELVDPMLTWRDLRAEVIEATHPTDRTLRLVLRPTRQWKGHQAGQYVQVSTVINGVRQTRCFSPSNASSTPRGDIELLITVNDDGIVSKHLRHTAKPSTVLGLSQAAGEFTLPAELGEQAVFISGGSGITPVLSMLRTLLAEGYAGQIVFIHYARSPQDVAYLDELGRLASQNSNLDLRLRYTRGPGGRHFDAEDLIGVSDNAQIFLCGPSSLMDAVTDRYDELGLTGRLHSEAFTLTPAVTIDPNEPITGELTFTASGRSTTNDGRTILEQAEAAGLSPEHGCRMGICFSCTKTKKTGCTRNVLTGDIDTEADKPIQLCINAPVGDVEIEV